MDLKTLEGNASACRMCELHRGRMKSVFARGPEKAPIFICGMCPGPEENIQGAPFVGTAGKILDTILDEVGCEAYITNLVKCFVQPGNPLEERWMITCLPYLVLQIEAVNPSVIVTLGKDVSNFLLNTGNTNIGALRNRNYSYMKRKLVCTYHPSYLARGGGVKHRDYHKVVEDFRRALQ